MFIYDWEGELTPYVAGYAYFIVDQLQNQDELKWYLNKHGGSWLMYNLAAVHPALQNIVRTIRYLTFNEKMMLVKFVERHKSNLLKRHEKNNTLPPHMQVKML